MIGPGGSTVFHTPEGGDARLFINKTGAPSIKGTIVDTEGSVDFSVKTADTNDPESMGVIWSNGIADGQKIWVVTHGLADVLLQDSTDSTRGYWAKVSATQAGRADITNAAPPGGGIPEIDEHFREIGHCVQSVTSGINKLARVHLHFN